MRPAQALLVASLLLEACLGFADDIELTPEVSVTGGLIRGVRLTNGVDQFTGIPFAKPPTPENDGRWRAPEEPESWEGTLSLTDWAPICSQGKQGDEDCLYLNVWTASSNQYRTDANATEDLLPVMMFIHGGGFETGSVQSYNGSDIMETLDNSIVYVTTPYRLGPFGFLGSEVLRNRTVGEFGGTTGNYGMLDQRMALKWLQENIATFGGDPSRVTIWGQSAGASSVSNHMSMPGSKGLYHRAIIESSSFSPSVSKTLESAEDLFARYTELLDCPSDGQEAVDCLLSKSAGELNEAAGELPACCDFFNIFLPWAPVVDGTELPLHPFEAIETEGALQVDDDFPILQGNNRDEGSLPLQVQPHNLDLDGLEDDWAFNYGAAQLDALNALYLPTSSPAVFYSPFYFADSNALGDFWVGCPTERVARKQRALGNRPLYQYNFQALDPFSFHGTETFFVFQFVLQNQKASDAAKSLAVLTAKYWANFGANGDPNADGVPNWPRYDSSALGSTQIIDLEGNLSHPTDGVKREECDFWIPYEEDILAECKERFPCGARAKNTTFTIETEITRSEKELQTHQTVAQVVQNFTHAAHTWGGFFA
uniref:Carboxylic ester hydrolase n=1 Tax=Pyramimonas obovata TaxID=1411642 RepID=A0A7S0RNP4_9CHLO|mmetsp:Transcript_38686/g.84144  ORF Transcript_38686/g.84144 Transcript_38686/m.84144 type:complete len:597 (+) Transcript_38686:331-2121(+)|eukprot:CAMPEP_0118942998 /NCGR_PEP_ID=MMETSP1169-20130426/37308_1 /TAXON_ID=36882 /ORGANISM="Pyramimonas obovata, Strain CCMP722" /LENGTH=596 /DNA_ID=CAMNT_0006888139 /DNA_START=275 /DNA_END=2065 /DNA_ORIENTATION=+